MGAQEQINEIKVDPSIKGKDFKIDEENGEPVLSTELANALVNLAETAEKTTVTMEQFAVASEEAKKKYNDNLAAIRKAYLEATNNASSVDKVIVDQFGKVQGLNRSGRRKMKQILKQNRLRQRG